MKLYVKIISFSKKRSKMNSFSAYSNKASTNSCDGYPTHQMTETLIDYRNQVIAKKGRIDFPYVPQYDLSSPAPKYFESQSGQYYLRQQPQEKKFQFERKLPYERPHGQFENPFLDNIAFARNRSKHGSRGSNNSHGNQLKQAQFHVEKARNILSNP